MYGVKYIDLVSLSPFPRPFSAYSSAVNKGILKEALLDSALTRVLTAHVRLGFFDSPSMVAYKRLPPQTINAPPHRALARWAASRVVVLLKNSKSTLPVDFSTLARTDHIAVVGPNADDIAALYAAFAPNTPLLLYAAFAPNTPLLLYAAFALNT